MYLYSAKQVLLCVARCTARIPSIYSNINLALLHIQTVVKCDNIHKEHCAVFDSENLIIHQLFAKKVEMCPEKCPTEALV